MEISKTVIRGAFRDPEAARDLSIKEAIQEAGGKSKPSTKKPHKKTFEDVQNNTKHCLPSTQRHHKTKAFYSPRSCVTGYHLAKMLEHIYIRKKSITNA